jgi:hypothetical protein
VGDAAVDRGVNGDIDPFLGGQPSVFVGDLFEVGNVVQDRPVSRPVEVGVTPNVARGVARGVTFWIALSGRERGGATRWRGLRPGRREPQGTLEGPQDQQPSQDAGNQTASDLFEHREPPATGQTNLV